MAKKQQQQPQWRFSIFIIFTGRQHASTPVLMDTGDSDNNNNDDDNISEQGIEHSGCMYALGTDLMCY